MQLSKNPKVSIIFPTHNGGNQPLECLASILKLAYPISSIEVIVIDNNSTDKSTSNLKSTFLFIKLIRLRHNTGFATAINRGIDQATGDYIFIANDDLVFGKNSLTRLIKHISRHSDIGIIGGKIFSKSDPSTVTSTGYTFNFWTGAISLSQNIGSLDESDWIQGCALLVRKKVLEQVGVLDEGFSFFFEDFDLCIRAKRSSWKVAYLPSAIFWHGGSTTVNRNITLKYVNWYKSKIRFILKHLPYTNIMSILLFQTLLVMPYRGFVLRDGRLLPYLKGIFWNFSNLLTTLRMRNNQSLKKVKE